jgi:hypothetical protein
LAASSDVEQIELVVDVLAAAVSLAAAGSSGSSGSDAAAAGSSGSSCTVGPRAWLLNVLCWRCAVIGVCVCVAMQALHMPQRPPWRGLHPPATPHPPRHRHAL